MKKDEYEKPAVPYWVKLLIVLGIEGLIAFVFIMKNGAFSDTVDIVEKYKILTDAFFVPGIIMVCAGMLAWVSSRGAFDGLAWSMGMFFKGLIPGGALKRESYGDYLERKYGDRKKATVSHILLGGIIFVLVSVVFLLLFFKYDSIIMCQ